MKSEDRFYVAMSVAIAGMLAVIVCLMLSFTIIITAENDSQSIVGSFGVLASIAIFISTIHAVANLTEEETREQ